jgi:hypothetical protein
LSAFPRRRRLEVRRRDEAQARRCSESIVNRAAFGAAGDRVGEASCRVGVAGGHRRDGRAVLATLARRLLVMAGASLTVGDRHRDRLRGRQRAVGDLHLHVVDVVAFRVGRCLESGAREKLSAPVLASIEKRAASAPPTIE